jgi:hypothetical protein
MSKVVSIRDRLELWHHAYTSPAGTVSASVSSHGRMAVSTSTGDTKYLDLTDTVAFLKNVSDTLDSVMKG